MEKIVSFELESNDNINLAKSIWDNLKNGWEKDLDFQKWGKNTGEPSYFFVNKQIFDTVFSLCINAYDRKVNVTVIRDRENDRRFLTSNEWNDVLDKFVEDHDLEDLKEFKWTKYGYDDIPTL